MRWYAMTRVFAPAVFCAVIALPSLSGAQAPAESVDLRGRGSYSAEDLAQTLFPDATPAVRTRGIGPARPMMSMPAPRPVVTINVLFPPRSESIPTLSYAEIDKLGTVLSWPQYTEYRIQLEGHTDNQGPERKNRLLSEKRVQSIKEYLTQRFAIAPDRVRTVGYGASKPIAPNDTPEGRVQNRRVEVVSLGRAE